MALGLLRVFRRNRDQENSAFPPGGKSAAKGSLPRNRRLGAKLRTRRQTVPKAKPRGRKRRQPGGRRAELRPVGVIRSTLRARAEAPKQGQEGAPDAWLEIHSFALPALDGLAAGDELLILTWLHQANRRTVKVRPRSNPSRPLTGVFATRSPDRPNPIGIHPVTVREVQDHRLRIGPIEVIDGTPVIDIKPVEC